MSPKRKVPQVHDAAIPARQQNRPPSGHSLWLRGVSLLTTVAFVWTTLLALPAQAVAQNLGTPAPANPKPIPPPAIHDDPSWHTIDYHKPRYVPTPATKSGLSPRPVSAPSFSLLDNTGRLGSAIPPANVAKWKAQLHLATAKGHKLSRAEVAKRHIWLGEYALAHDEQYDEARWHFNQAQQLSGHSDIAYGLASYDKAILTFSEGAFLQSVGEFDHLLRAKPGLRGFDRRTCTVCLRHARACAGYHAERAAIGIPEPPKRDPLCGLSAIAQALKAAGKPHDTALLLANVRATGRGSNLQDLVTGAQKLGFNAHVVHTTEQGLIDLPKPLIAYVEHDHFISVLHADKKGVEYLCSDCGPWPGGNVRLTWKQWRRLEATVFTTLTLPGTVADNALALLDPKNNSNRSALQLASLNLNLSDDLIATMRLSNRLKKQSQFGWNGQLEGISCGGPPRLDQCPCVVECPMHGSPLPCGSGPKEPVNLASGEEDYSDPPDLSIYNPIGPSVAWTRRYDSLRGYDTAYDFQDFGIGWSHSYNYSIYDPNAVRRPGTISPGDVINIPVTGTDAPTNPDQWEIWQGNSLVATDQNPNGWNVSALLQSQGHSYITVGISRYATFGTYEVKALAGSGGQNGASLRRGLPAIASIHRGQHSLDSSCQIVGGGGSGPESAYFTVGPRFMNTTTGTRYLVEPNGARIAFTANSVPTAANPQVSCPVAPGHPFQVWWNYNPNDVNGSYTVQYSNRGVMKFEIDNGILINQNGATMAGSALSYALTLVADNNGNTSYLSYSGTNFSYNGFPLLLSIADAHHNSLLTLNRDPVSLLITSATDRYGRSVYYSIGTYPIQNAWPGRATSTPELDHVSQVVATNTPNPPDHYVYGYQNIFNGDVSPSGNETFPFVHTISVPSPTGTGMSTVTINYNPGNCTIANFVDANGNIHSFSQPDMSHTQVRITDVLGNILYRFTVGFDANMSTTSVTNGVVDANGNNTQVVSDAVYADPNDPYRPSVVMNAVGYAGGGNSGAGIWQYTWDAFGNCLTATTPRNTIVTYTFDYTRFALGELTSTQTGTKQATTFTYYEPTGNLHTVNSPLPGTVGGNQSVTMSYTYSTLGNLLTVTTPGNNTVASMKTTYGYGMSEALGLPVTITDNLSKTTQFQYDSQGRTITLIDANGNTSSVTYNLVGQPLTVHENGPGTTQDSYLYPQGPLTQTALYDGNGNLYRHISPVYGNQGEVLTTTGDVNPVNVAYDGLYRVTAIVDGNGNHTWNTYNQAGYLTQSQLANGNTYQSTSWDANGNVLSTVDARGVVTNYSYTDPESQLTDVQHPIAPTLDVHYVYDSYGRPTSVTDGTGTRAAAYDDNDATTALTTTYINAVGNGNLPSLTLGYSYYPNGNLSGMSTPAGNFAYGFDGRGLPNSLTNPQGQNFGWNYFDNGWLATQTLSNIATSTFSYDGLGQLTQLTHRQQNRGQSVLADFSGMTHDVVGNRLSLSTSLPNAPSTYNGATAYQYDNRNELTSEVSQRAGGYSNNYVYDLVGNPTTWKGAGQNFNSVNQNTQGGTLSFDHNGNPAGYQGTALNWDVNDKLYSFGNTLTAGYTSEGLRAWKQTAAGRTYYLYNGTTPICELDVNGNVTAVNTWGAKGLLSRYVRSGNIDGNVFYCFDPQGSVSVRLDSSGNILSSHTNEAWGTQLSTATTNDPYAGYGGQWGYYKDAETGLHLLGQRYYDTSNGRFLNRDPIGYAGGINVYGYSGSSPIGRIDPRGNGWIAIGAGATTTGGILVGALLITGAPVSGPVLAIGFVAGFAVGYLTSRYYEHNSHEDATGDATVGVMLGGTGFEAIQALGGMFACYLGNRTGSAPVQLPDCRQLADQKIRTLGGGQAVRITPDPPWQPLYPPTGYQSGVIAPTESGTWFEHFVVEHNELIYDDSNIHCPLPWDEYQKLWEQPINRFP